jgi:Fe-S-cluster containining protein
MLEFDWFIGTAWEPLINAFPYAARPDGACMKLGDDGGCTVYDDRPSLCKVEEGRDLISPKTPIDVWYEDQEKACRILMRESGKFTEREIKKAYSKKNRRNHERGVETHSFSPKDTSSVESR